MGGTAFPHLCPRGPAVGEWRWDVGPSAYNLLAIVDVVKARK
jgi:hypothetical protein